MADQESQTYHEDALTENQQRLLDVAADQTVFTPAEVEVIEAYVGHDDRTLDDVADQLDKNPWTIRTLWSRAQRKLDQAQTTVNAVGDYNEFNRNRGNTDN